MENGTYTITNLKTGSKLVIQLTDDVDASVVQYDKDGKHTAQQAKTRTDASNAIEKMKTAGMSVEYEPLKDICGNAI